jgi:hypothetical protein
MKKAERRLKDQHSVYCLGRIPVEGDPSKRAGAPSHLQTWSRYMGMVWKRNSAGWENSSGMESVITRGS